MGRAEAKYSNGAGNQLMTINEKALIKERAFSFINISL